MGQYLSLLKNKGVAIVANHSSMIGDTHLVDSLLALQVAIKKVFAPEHGFRGAADAGETVKNSKDKRTGLPVISLYGSRKKPSAEELKGIDVIVFDIQDVGTRFYTYISTMHYVMEACAENGKTLIVLDRPNPNGHFVDGPVREEQQKSFVGMHPVPIVHGMTIGEYAQMINGEGWLPGGRKCDLKVITCKGWNHQDLYQLPVKPSPNLPNMSSVYLYPSLCLFEGTIVSVGRGTDKPFQVIGYPGLTGGRSEFTPRSVVGAKHPPYENEKCSGFDLSQFGTVYMRSYKKIYLFWLKSIYEQSEKKNFFTDYFNLLAGNTSLQQQIKDGKDIEEIRATWEEGLNKFKSIRKKYLLYPDFD